MRRSTRSDDVVVSTRVRLARNLAGISFPDRADDSTLEAIEEKVSTALKKKWRNKSFSVSGLGEISSMDREYLKEAHLISAEFARKKKGGVLALQEDLGAAVMVNEEDHLRLQIIMGGLDVFSCWEALDDLDSQLDRELDYAFSPKIGYLTACPSNVGTGLRVSVMMHLPGLTMMREMNAVVKGLNRVGLIVRGVYGEGSEVSGNIYQISNQATLGETELEIVERIARVAGDLAVHERNARGRMLEQQRIVVLDGVHRSLAIMRNALLITSDEGNDLLSELQFGLWCGILSGVTQEKIGEAWLVTRPAHLQKEMGRQLGLTERDAVRALLLKDLTKAVKVTGRL